MSTETFGEYSLRHESIENTLWNECVFVDQQGVLWHRQAHWTFPELDTAYDLWLDSDTDMKTELMSPSPSLPPCCDAEARVCESRHRELGATFLRAHALWVRSSFGEVKDGSNTMLPAELFRDFRVTSDARWLNVVSALLTLLSALSCPSAPTFHDKIYRLYYQSYGKVHH